VNRRPREASLPFDRIRGPQRADARALERERRQRGQAKDDRRHDRESDPSERRWLDDERDDEAIGD
jgi:hypothetical protein